MYTRSYVTDKPGNSYITRHMMRIQTDASNCIDIVHTVDITTKPPGQTESCYISDFYVVQL